MEWIEHGKEEVLSHLEKEAEAKSGATGQYALGRDEAGNMFAFIAGHMFVGNGIVQLGDNTIVVSSGIVVEVKEP